MHISKMKQLVLIKDERYMSIMEISFHGLWDTLGLCPFFFKYGQKKKDYFGHNPQLSAFTISNMKKVYSLPFWSKLQKSQALQNVACAFLFLRLQNTEFTTRKFFYWKNMQRVFSFRTLGKKSVKTEKWN